MIDAITEAKKCLYAAAILADGYGKPKTAATFRAAREGLENHEAELFAGWICKAGPGESFHSDPLDGCKGPHIPVWTKAAAT